MNASGYAMDEINESDDNENAIQIKHDNTNETDYISLDITEELKILENDD